VFPKELAESYAEAFSIAGISLLSLEVEASSVARAVSDGEVEAPVTLLVDFGTLRTGFAVLKRGIPIFTSTVTLGGESIDKAIVAKLSLSPEELETFKNEEGLFAKGGKNSPAVEILAGTVAALSDEIARHYHYWDTRRNDKGERMTPVERIYLLGGGANLKGIGDYIAGRVQVECIRPNVWQNVCSFDEYIPPIGRRDSLRFATAIGLALRSF
jgi:Tfp pilus assembly PilM family ATPase